MFDVLGLRIVDAKRKVKFALRIASVYREKTLWGFAIPFDFLIAIWRKPEGDLVSP